MHPLDLDGGVIVWELNLMELEETVSGKECMELTGIASGKSLHLLELDGAEVVFELHLVELEGVASG
jgi:hypothetical protein